MSVLTSAPRPRKQCPPVDARGRLTTGGDRLADLFAGAAILAVTTGDGTDSDTRLYWCRAVADRGRVVALDLTKFGTGETYRVSIDPDTGAAECGCPDSVYRSRRCRHVSGLLDALRRPEPMPEVA